jgi:hypothetical protein
MIFKSLLPVAILALTVTASPYTNFCCRHSIYIKC